MEKTPRVSRSAALRLALIAALATGIVVAALYRDQLNLEAIKAWVVDAGMAAPLLFIALYALATVFFLPGSVLTLAGGALFGPILGTLINLTGATLGATLAFVIARYVGADWVQRRIGGRLARLKSGVEAEGWRFVAFVRLVPLFPFNLLNYALGLTRIRLSHYVAASFVFMLPGAIAYTYLGYAGREAVAGGEGLVQKILLALALLAVVAFLPRLVARLRQRPMIEIAELKSRLEQQGELVVLDVRSPEEYVGELGHVAGSLNIPLDQLPSRLDELGDDPERKIAIVCRTDRRSAKAAALLTRRGFADVRVMRGGMTAWLEQGWPVEREVVPGGGSG
jgi:uncharacterized membrane protein YdjX (TVP38/TMEM64 family)/rhodanese-related sulfurtransferase